MRKEAEVVPSMKALWWTKITIFFYVRKNILKVFPPRKRLQILSASTRYQYLHKATKKKAEKAEKHRKLKKI